MGIILAIIAIILGAVSLGKINRNPELYSGWGFAITGLLIGIFGLLVVGLILVL